MVTEIPATHTNSILVDAQVYRASTTEQKKKKEEEEEEEEEEESLKLNTGEKKNC